MKALFTNPTRGEFEIAIDDILVENQILSLDQLRKDEIYDLCVIYMNDRLTAEEQFQEIFNQLQKQNESYDVATLGGFIIKMQKLCVDFGELEKIERPTSCSDIWFNIHVNAVKKAILNAFYHHVEKRFNYELKCILQENPMFGKSANNSVFSFEHQQSIMQDMQEIKRNSDQITWGPLC